MNATDLVCNVSHTRLRSQHTLYRSSASLWKCRMMAASPYPSFMSLMMTAASHRICLASMRSMSDRMTGTFSLLSLSVASLSRASLTSPIVARSTRLT